MTSHIIYSFTPRHYSTPSFFQPMCGQFSGYSSLLIFVQLEENPVRDEESAIKCYEIHLCRMKAKLVRYKQMLTSHIYPHTCTHIRYAHAHTSINKHAHVTPTQKDRTNSTNPTISHHPPERRASDVFDPLFVHEGHEQLGVNHVFLELQALSQRLHKQLGLELEHVGLNEKERGINGMIYR